VVFIVARQLQGEARTIYLKQVCGDEPVVRARVEVLLRAREEHRLLPSMGDEVSETLQQPIRS
jgi:hypothetical protein